MKNAAVLLTVHNRKQETLKSLEKLYDSVKHSNADVKFDVYLTDDGSTDGTWEALEVNFPEIRLIKGDSNLYWGRGMICAWEQAVAERDYDGFFWLNNDSFLNVDAMQIMLKAVGDTSENALISGAFVSKASGKTTYGGKIKDKVLTPDGTLQKFTQLNGNFVFVPRKVFDRIGMMNGYYHHSLGDYDYGYRAAKAGFGLYLTPCYVGTCEPHREERKFRDPQFSLPERFSHLYSPLGPSPFTLFKFNARYFSIFKAVSIFLYTNVVCLFPRIRKVVLSKRK